MIHRAFLRALATLSLVGGVSACSSLGSHDIPPDDRIDPLNTAPGDIAVAIGVPKTLLVDSGDAVLHLGFASAGAAPMSDLRETADLVLRPAGDGAPRATSEEERVYVARIAAGDIPSIAEAQSQIKTLRAQGVKGEGTLAIELTGGCFVGAVPERIAVSAWIQTDGDADFVELTRGSDILQAIGAREAALLRSRLSPC